jgi:UDP-N-acetylmuramoylalanine-D-glutamate ligase
VGNIGVPVFDEIDLINNNTIYDFIIYELSSYMLETFQPQCTIALISNIYTCHLDWHNNDFGTYENAKLNILKKSENKIISETIKNNNAILDNNLFY